MEYRLELISFIVMFGLVIGIILVVVIKQWHANSRAPRLVVNATVAGKRIQRTRRITRGATRSHVKTNRTYFVTFQAEGGDCMEFFVRKREYEVLAKGDAGKLTFQGSRYLGFEKA